MTWFGLRLGVLGLDQLFTHDHVMEEKYVCLLWIILAVLTGVDLVYSQPGLYRVSKSYVSVRDRLLIVN